MAKNHPLIKDVKNWIVDSFSFMDGVGYDILFDDDIYGMENTKVFSADIDGLTDFDFEKGKKNLLKSIPNKIKAEFPYLRITSGKEGDYFIMFIVLLDNNDYLEDKNIQYINLNESMESVRKSIKESDDNWYKLKMLNEMLDAMAKDEYNIPKLGIYGVTKNIDLDEGAIRALIKYYK